MLHTSNLFSNKCIQLVRITLSSLPVAKDFRSVFESKKLPILSFHLFHSKYNILYLKDFSVVECIFMLQVPPCLLRHPSLETFSFRETTPKRNTRRNGTARDSNDKFRRFANRNYSVVRESDEEWRWEGEPARWRWMTARRERESWFYEAREMTRGWLAKRKRRRQMLDEAEKTEGLSFSFCYGLRRRRKAGFIYAALVGRLLQ